MAHPVLVPPELRAPAGDTPRRVRRSDGGGRISSGPGAGVDATGQAPTPLGFSLGSLLRGLQRGAVPDADPNVSFLCHKYSTLVERLRRAEDGELRAKELCREEEATVAAQALEDDHVELQMAAVRREAQALEAGLCEAQTEEARAEGLLHAACAEEEALEQRWRQLEEQRTHSQSRLTDTRVRIQQAHSSRPESEHQLQRLQAQLVSLAARQEAGVTELTTLREQAAREEARMADVRAEIQGEEDARSGCGGAATAQRHELDEALDGLAALRERLAEAQARVKRGEGELRRQKKSKEAMQEGVQRHEAWAAEAASELQALQGTEQGALRVRAQTAELRDQCEAEVEASRRVQAANAAAEAAVADVGCRLEPAAARVADAVGARWELQSRAAQLRSERAQLEEEVERLAHEKATSENACLCMERELQAVLDEAEKLRIDGGAHLAGRAQAHQRMQLMSPALTEARRKWQELESTLKDAQSSALQEQRMEERLEREAADCQDKIHALRKENLRLVEKCAELQAEIPDSPRRLSSSIGSGRTTERPSSAGAGAGAAPARRSASASPAAQSPAGLCTPAAAARGRSRLEVVAPPTAGGASARPRRAPAGSR